MERAEGYSFRRILDRIKSDLEKAGFDVTMHPREVEPVYAAFIRLPGLLYDAGLTSHRTEKLSIKLEIDTNPPAGATTKTTIVNRHFLIAIFHHDLPSMMAGKLHALLTRPCTKGRDLYDLLWYLSRSEPTSPNLVLLQNALTQTNWSGGEVTAATWKAVVEDRLRKMDFVQAVEDVGPFLESPEERVLLAREIVLAALRGA
ncbi:nucleotidyl transferase AbiEii/AbiGii toxin family protein [Candidatus Bipolaricaulota bacterium]|nr:nucleotidyl transferase AbiEii/AbiGii toxin family protein [Candidatus Bipolaricaulota bacterium]